MKKIYLIAVLLAVLAMPLSAAKKEVKVADIHPQSERIAAPGKMMKAYGSKVIYEAPEGTLYKNVSRNAQSFEYIFGEVYLNDINSSVTQLVEGNDGNLYLWNPIWSYPTSCWVKLEPVEGNKYILKNQQVYYDYWDDYEIYIYEVVAAVATFDDSGIMRITADKTAEGVFFTWENGVLTMDENAVLALMDVSYGGYEWFGYADYLTEVSVINETLHTLPVEETQQFFLSYYDVYDIAQPAYVNVKIDGSDIYIGNFPGVQVGTYIKGTIDGATATFPAGQYLGVNDNATYHMYFYSAYIDQIYNPDYEEMVDAAIMDDADFVFEYDAETGNLWSPDMFLVNQGTVANANAILFNEPAMAPFVEVAATPSDPYFIEYYSVEELGYGMGFMTFYVPIISTEGEIMNTEKLSYVLYDDGEVFTLEPDTYFGIGDKAMTEIPYSFSDGAGDIYSTGSEKSLMFYKDFVNAGVQVIYRGAGEERRSNIIYHEDRTSNVDNVSSAKIVESIRYYDLTGREVENPTAGIYVRSVKFNDGTIANGKISVK